MIKGLFIAILLTFSTLSFAQYSMELVPEGDELVLYVDGNTVARASFKGTNAEKATTLGIATHQMQFCGQAGNWANVVATDAANDPYGKQYHLDYIKEFSKDKKVPQQLIDLSNEVIEKAYSIGYRDPYTFGYVVIEKCLERMGK